MTLLCVTNVDVAGKILLNGGIMLRKGQDVNGQFVWFFDADKLTFDIGDAVKRGDAFFSNTMSIAF